MMRAEIWKDVTGRWTAAVFDKAASPDSKDTPIGLRLPEQAPLAWKHFDSAEAARRWVADLIGDGTGFTAEARAEALRCWADPNVDEIALGEHMALWGAAHADDLAAEETRRPEDRFRVYGGRVNHITQAMDEIEVVAWCGIAEPADQARFGEDRPDCWPCKRKQAAA